MAKYEEAYSTEIRDIVDAEKAYELFWEGKIKDKRAFQCTDPNCQAQITCANIDKERSEMKQVPHFNCYGEHNKNCEVAKELKELEDKNHNEGKRKPIHYIDKKNDIFSFERPKRDSIITRGNKVEDKNEHRKRKEKIKEDLKSSGSRSTTYYSIKPLISKFEKYVTENTLGKKYITIKGNKVSYKRMFVKVEDTEVEQIEKYFRIYYGEGSIFRSTKKPGDYYIFLKQGFNKNEKNVMIYINKSTIEKSFMKNKWKENLEYLCNHKEDKVIFYVNCKPKVQEGIITLPLYNLDYFDYRIVK